MIKVRVVVAAALLVGLGTVVQAGRANYFETFVDMASRQAFGSFVDTRRTPDNVQYIACDVSVRPPSDARVTCVARSTTAGPLSCSSSRPEFVAMVQGMSDLGYARFHCEAGEIVYMYVSKGSLWLD